MKALAKVTELMSSSRRLLSTSASLHQLSHRRYGKGTWLAQDCQWNFKCQGLGFGFVLGSHQKCLSFEVTGSDGCLQKRNRVQRPCAATVLNDWRTGCIWVVEVREQEAWKTALSRAFQKT